MRRITGLCTAFLLALAPAASVPACRGGGPATPIVARQLPAPQLPAASIAGSVAPAVSAPAAEAPRVPDFAPVFENCRSSVHAVGADTLVTALRARDDNYTITIARWSDDEAKLVDIETVGPIFFGEVASDVTASAYGASFRAAWVLLYGDCKNNHGPPDRPSACKRADIARRAGRFRVVAEPRWVVTDGLYADQNYLLLGKRPNPIVARYLPFSPPLLGLAVGELLA